MGGWDYANVAAKLALYVGVFGAFGTLIVQLWFGTILGTLRHHIRGLCLLGLVASLASFLLTAVPLTGQASAMIDPEMLSLMWSTAVGDALVLRVAGLVVMGVAIGLRYDWIAALGGAAALWSFTTIGHISGLENGLISLVLFGHLLAVATWIGLLWPLWRLAKHQAPATYDVGHSFGARAAVFVPFLALAGVIMSRQLVGGWAPLVTTDYGLLLLTKVLVFALLFGAAAVNKLWMMPAIGRGKASAYSQLCRVITFEAVCVSAILILTAILTSVTALPS